MRTLSSTSREKKSDTYILDTFKMGNRYRPGAITFYGRKKMDAVQWKDKAFPTQSEADDFVRQEFARMYPGITELSNEGELREKARR